MVVEMATVGFGYEKINERLNTFKQKLKSEAVLLLSFVLR